MDGRKHITMFDHPYPMEKQAEGVAVSQAVADGHCDRCGYLPQCETDKNFSFPPMAWCFRRKMEILREWEA